MSMVPVEKNEELELTVGSVTLEGDGRGPGGQFRCLCAGGPSWGTGTDTYH